MINLFRQMILQSPFSGISLCLALGCIFLVIQSVIFSNDMPPVLLAAELLVSILLGVFLHYFLKRKQKLRKHHVRVPHKSH